MEINKEELYTRERYDSALGTSGTFMSNFFQLSSPIRDIMGNEYWNSEGYYMALRTNILEEKTKIAIMSKAGGKASRGARNLFKLEMDEDKRAEYMLDVVTEKFNKRYLQLLLLETGEQEIIEKNYWKDDLFGVREDTLKGANILGKTLMQIRALISRADYMEGIQIP